LVGFGSVFAVVELFSVVLFAVGSLTTATLLVFDE